MFGEIIYGGHIVEDWDRRLAAAYLSKLINESLLETPELFPNFVAPPSAYSIPQVCVCAVHLTLECNLQGSLRTMLCIGLHSLG